MIYASFSKSNLLVSPKKTIFFLPNVEVCFSHFHSKWRILNIRLWNPTTQFSRWSWHVYQPNYASIQSLWIPKRSWNVWDYWEHIILLPQYPWQCDSMFLSSLTINQAITHWYNEHPRVITHKDIINVIYWILKHEQTFLGPSLVKRILIIFVNKT